MLASVLALALELHNLCVFCSVSLHNANGKATHLLLMLAQIADANTEEELGGKFKRRRRLFEDELGGSTATKDSCGAATDEDDLLPACFLPNVDDVSGALAKSSHLDLPYTLAQVMGCMTTTATCSDLSIELAALIGSAIFPAHDMIKCM